MAKRYNMVMKLSAKDVQLIYDKLSKLRNRLPQLRDTFVKLSLDYLEQQARMYIQQSTGGSSWYELSGKLESSFKKNYVLGTLVNDCYYSAFVEYGTGVVGQGTHPLSDRYQYDVNGHGNDGWYFRDDEGIIHFTKGMVAHRYMYNAINDYYFKGYYKKLFEIAIVEVIGGIL